MVAASGSSTTSSRCGRSTTPWPRRTRTSSGPRRRSGRGGAREHAARAARTVGRAREVRGALHRRRAHADAATDGEDGPAPQDSQGFPAAAVRALDQARRGAGRGRSGAGGSARRAQGEAAGQGARRARGRSGARPPVVEARREARAAPLERAARGGLRPLAVHRSGADAAGGAGGGASAARDEAARRPLAQVARAAEGAVKQIALLLALTACASYRVLPPAPLTDGVQE